VCSPAAELGSNSCSVGVRIMYPSGVSVERDLNRKRSFDTRGISLLWEIFIREDLA
jgi:hypothetical protein